MKNITAVVFACIFCLSLVIAGSVSAQEAVVGQVIYFLGDVSITSVAGVEKNIAPRTPIEEGDKIVTGQNSMVEMVFGNPRNNNAVKVEENSSAVVKNSELVVLDKGKLFLLLSNIPEGRKFEAKTPVAISGARGTGWTVATDGSTDDIATHLNTIYVKVFDAEGNLIDEKNLTAGDKTKIKKFKSIGALLSTSAKEQEAWREWVYGVGVRLENFLKDEPVAEPFEEPGTNPGDFDTGETNSDEGQEETAEGTPPADPGSSEDEDTWEIGIGGVILPEQDEPEIGIGGVILPEQDEPEIGIGGVNIPGDDQPEIGIGGVILPEQEEIRQIVEDVNDIQETMDIVKEIAEQRKDIEAVISAKEDVLSSAVKDKNDVLRARQ